MENVLKCLVVFFGNFLAKNPAVKLGKSGKAGGGHSVLESGRILNDIRQTF
jgi:hypothetical protein